MTAKPRRRKSYPLALLNNKVNLDQLLAINNAMRYPLAYVQARRAPARPTPSSTR